LIDNYSTFLDDPAVPTNNKRRGCGTMEHEDKPAPLPPSEGVDRPRVVSAAAEPAGNAGSIREPLPSPARNEDEVRRRPVKGPGAHPNNVRRLRIERMMSKAELARRANVSVLTIDRVEKGFGCRMDTKRKILEALGLTLADRVRVFGEDE
jgi:DNA-binding XRE family transcriptional regulator